LALKLIRNGPFITHEIHGMNRGELPLRLKLFARQVAQLSLFSGMRHCHDDRHKFLCSIVTPDKGGLMRIPHLANNQRGVLALLILLTFSLAACSQPPIQARLTHSPLPSPQQRFSEPLVMQKLAVDHRKKVDRIGHVTGTVFFIEMRTVEPDHPVIEEITTQVKEALESAGSLISFENSQEPGSALSFKLKVDVNEFYFKSHSWLWPITPLSGDIVLELTLESPEGKIVYDKSFGASGSSFRMAHDEGFDAAINEAMTKILNQIVVASLSEDFHKAMR
jgi:hypothetical protein